MGCTTVVATSDATKDGQTYLLWNFDMLRPASLIFKDGWVSEAFECGSFDGMSDLPWNECHVFKPSYAMAAESRKVPLEIFFNPTILSDDNLFSEFSDSLTPVLRDYPSAPFILTTVFGYYTLHPSQGMVLSPWVMIFVKEECYELPLFFVDEQIGSIRETVGNGLAINALSGGVDSSVVTVLGHRSLAAG
jgi:hypothetical protein